MAFDYKKEYKELYVPKTKPSIIEVPPMNVMAIRGKGNPNADGGEYSQAMTILYPVAYTLKMSYKTDHKIDGFFEYVVPPLEGFWWEEGVKGMDYTKKDLFHWISFIRLPDFITQEDFEWAKKTAAIKKGIDCSKLEFMHLEEGLCVQMMHLGPFDDEPKSVAIMDEFLEDKGYENDFSDVRMHHEIYLSDPRKVSPEKYRTVIRHPIRKK